MKTKKFAFLFCALSCAIFLISCSNASGGSGTSGGNGNENSSGGGVTQTPALVYSVNTPVVSGGTVTASPTSGTVGTEITLTATPKTNCYVLESFIVVDSNSDPVSVDANGKFTLPEGGVTVTATFKTVPPSSPYIPVGTQEINSTSYELVTFGSWPQTIKATAVEVNDQCESKTVGEFTYYMGSDGYWYAKSKENSYDNGRKYSDGSFIGQNGNSEKWFKVEPIKWRVLTKSYNGTNGKKLLLAENVLIGRRYDDDFNNYQNSEIRKWLNSNTNSTAVSDHSGSGGFLRTAFTATEQSKIADSSVDNSKRSTNTDECATQWYYGDNEYASATPTTDKIFLLSEQEVTKNEYGFDLYNRYVSISQGVTNSTRIRQASDYAKASDAWPDTPGSDWWLRSPYYNFNTCARFVNNNGSADCYDSVDLDHRKQGVVPALCVENVGN